VVVLGRTHKQTFLQGALILVLANAIVKIIGAGFKIPLTYLIGPDGMGIYSVSYEIYKWLFIVATAGFPVAVSKMVSESLARNNYAEAHKVFHVSFYLLGAIGIVGSAIMFFGAEFFADRFGNSRAYLAVMAMSPSLFFVSLMSAYRGYFQGRQNMIPTAVSEIIEALGKLIVGYTLAFLWASRGVVYSSAGAILGVSTGTFLGFAALYFIYEYSKSDIKRQIAKNKESGVAVRRTGTILKQLIHIAIPITIGASVFSLTTLIDAFMIMNRLQSIGFTEEQASTMFGYLSSYATTMFSFPATIVTALSVSIVPTIAGALAVKNTKQVKKTTESALRITILFSIAAGVGLSVLAKPILLLVFKDDGATQLLNVMGLAVLFVCLVSVTNAMLQAVGRIYVPVRNMLIGGVIKVIINYYLVGIIDININGAPIGTNVCYLTITILNLIEIKKFTNVDYKFSDFVLKPLVSVASMAVTAVYSYGTIMEHTQSNAIATLSSICLAGIIYILMLFAVGGIKIEDIEMLPKGKNIARHLTRLKLIK